jgi:hypothetical protein
MGNSYPGIHRLAVRGRRLPELRHPGPLFTGVRGIGILRTSPFGHSRKFVISKQHLCNTKLLKIVPKIVNLTML